MPIHSRVIAVRLLTTLRHKVAHPKLLVMGTVSLSGHTPGCDVGTFLDRASPADDVEIAMWSSMLHAVLSLSILRTIACCESDILPLRIACKPNAPVQAPSHASRSMSLFHSRVQSGPSVATRLLALHVFDIFVAQRLTMLLAMTRFLPSRAKIWSLVAPHSLTTCALVVVMPRSSPWSLQKRGCPPAGPCEGCFWHPATSQRLFLTST